MDERTERFVEAALERGWIAPDQVEEARRIHETVAEVGVDQSLEEILVKKGWLTPDQARHLSRELSVTKVGKYEILEKLGEGGAGIVYKANQEPLERMVAIKVLSKRRAGSEKYLERFLREARVAVTLNHRNIVRGLDYGEADGYHYFVMEYVEGDSLYSVLKREGVLDEKRALEITLEVVSALQHASAYALVHRDIKPENVLIARDGVVKLCDLGLAKPSLVETARGSRDGTTIGTPTYMSPEQIRGKDDADFRSDVYSLGATLYHMVTGRPPFTGESPDILVRKHLRESPVDPREHNLKLSSSTATIVTKMLAKKPEDRYPSLDQLAEDLKSVLEGRPPTHTIQLGGSRPGPAKVRIDAEDGGARRSRRAETERKKARGPLLALVAVLLLAGVAAAVLLTGGGDDSAGGGTAVAPEPEEPAGPTPGELAEELYLEAKDFQDRNPGAPAEAKIDRFRLVLRKYPETRHGLMAKDRIREIESMQEAIARRHAEEAKEHYEARREAAGALVAAGRYGDAIQALSEYPDGYADTEYPKRLATEAKELAARAGEVKKEAFEEADARVRAGDFEKAVRALERLAGIGIASIESDVRDKLEEIREAERAEREAREKGRRVFRAAVGTAFLTAAGGDWQEAEDALVRAGEREELLYHGEELNAAFRDLREARRFEEAMVEGADGMAGETVRLALTKGARATAVGKVLGANREAVRLARPGGEETVPFHSVVPSDRVRLAFEVLDGNAAADHEAAALYLVVHGYLDEAEAEIRAAGVLGAATTRLQEVKKLYATYLGERADVEILRAEGHRGRDRTAEAKEILAGVVERSPWYAPARYHYGAVLAETGEFEAAIVQLEKARELGSVEPKLFLHLGEAYARLDRPEAALDAWSRFADLSQDDPVALEKARARINELREVALAARIEKLSEEAREAHRRNRLDEAIELYRKLNDLSPNAEDSLYHLGRAWLEKEEVLEAYRSFTSFLDAAPGSRRASDARKQVRTLEKTWSENTETVKFLTEGISELQGGNYQLAVALFDRAIKEGPLNEDAYYRRYVAHLRIGESLGREEDFEAALADLDAVELLNPDNVLVHEGRAILHYYLEDHDRALAEAEIAMKALPDRWQSYNIAGLVHRAKGDYEKALAVLTAGLDRAPDEVTLWINRALARENRKEYEKAREDLAAANDRKPNAHQLAEIGRILDRLLKAEREE